MVNALPRFPPLTRLVLHTAGHRARLDYERRVLDDAIFLRAFFQWWRWMRIPVLAVSAVEVARDVLDPVCGRTPI